MFARALLTKHLKKQKQKQADKDKAEQKNVGQNVDTQLGKKIDHVFAQEGFAAYADAPALTAEQAAKLRVSFRKHGSLLSPWQIIMWQAVLGALLAIAAGWLTGKDSVAWSVAYGALAVVIPAAVFARGLMSQFSGLNALTAGLGFFVWELIKIVATVVLIAIAPKLVTDLDWLAMLIGLIVTMKVVFVLLWLLPKLSGKTATAE